MLNRIFVSFALLNKIVKFMDKTYQQYSKKKLGKKSRCCSVIISTYINYMVIVNGLQIKRLYLVTRKGHILKHLLRQILLVKLKLNFLHTF